MHTLDLIKLVYFSLHSIKGKEFTRLLMKEDERENRERCFDLLNNWAFYLNHVMDLKMYKVLSLQLIEVWIYDGLDFGLEFINMLGL